MAPTLDDDVVLGVQNLLELFDHTGDPGDVATAARLRGVLSEITPGPLIELVGDTELTVGPGGYPATSSGPMAEFYNMMMAHFDGSRATPFLVNVQHPDFGATGQNDDSNNDEPALTAASYFATLDAEQTGMREVWLPATGSSGSRARYYVDDPFRVYNGTTVSGYGARIAASPRFDFTTKFAINSGTGEDRVQYVLEGYNPHDDGSGRFSMGRYHLKGMLVEGLQIDASNGAFFNIQQQSTWHGVRFHQFRNVGLHLQGQQAVFHDLMFSGESTEPGDSSVHPMRHLQLGHTEADGSSKPASFMWFHDTNFERFHTAVHIEQSIGANVFRDNHCEASGDYADDGDDPAICFFQKDGQLVVDQGWLTAGGSGNWYSTFYKADPDNDSASFHFRDIFLQTNGPPAPNRTIFIDDEKRGHLIYAWGDTRLVSGGDEGIVRLCYDIIGPRRGDSTWPMPYITAILHDEGGYTAMGAYDSGTVDAEQLPLMRMRPGSTQLGHLISYCDRSGDEQHVVTADGLPKFPAFTNAAAFPTAAAANRGTMIYNLDTDTVHISDGSAWKELSVV